VKTEQHIYKFAEKVKVNDKNETKHKQLNRNKTKKTKQKQNKIKALADCQMHQ